MAHKEFVHPAMSDLADSLSKTDQRHEREQKLEKLLWDFQADALEAENLLVCLMGRLVEDEEIQTYVVALRKALERYPQRLAYDQGDEDDEAYSLMRARQE